MTIFVVLLTGFCQLAVNAKAWIYSVHLTVFHTCASLQYYVLLIPTAVL